MRGGRGLYFPYKMKIGILTDEISQDVEKAFSFGKRLGIDDYELRSVWGKRVPGLKEKEITELEELIAKYKVNITSISPGLLKVPLSSSELINHKNQLLDISFSFAERLGVKNIIIFGLIQKKENFDNVFTQIVKNIEDVVKKASVNNFEILLENEASCYADTAVNTLKILEAIDYPCLKMNWDPGNSYRAGGHPYPYGYELIKKYVGNIHVKDVKTVNGVREWTTIDKGEIDWKRQIGALKRDNYQGMCIIENHIKPIEEKTKTNLYMIVSL